MFLSLSLSMIGCASNPGINRNAPPKNLLQHTEVPAYSGTTFGDHYDYIKLLISRIDTCNVDKDSIRDYYKKKGSK